MKAEEFAKAIGAKVTLPSRPLLQRREGEAQNYFTHTDVKATFERLKTPATKQPLRRAK